jgi:hypothetical protein
MDVAALVFWVLTALFGFTMLVIWLRRGGTAGGSHFPPALIFGHFLLAATGLVIWIVYVFNEAAALAWTACVILLVVAGLGDVMVLRWWRDRRAVTAVSPGPGAQAAPGAGRPAEQHFPVPVVAVHGLLAVVTIVLVLLTALGVGEGAGGVGY